MTESNEWVVPGAAVVGIVRRGWYPRIEFKSKVAKVTARDVVLANGKRFRRSDLEEYTKSSYGARLVQPNSPQIKEILAREKRQRLINDARNAEERWNKSRENAEGLDGLITALNALRANLLEDA